MGKQPIEIKKIEDKDKRVVTFSKRRKGLFKKAAFLSSNCDAQVAAIVFSDTGKLYSYGHPSVDQLIRRYNTSYPPSQNQGDINNNNNNSSSSNSPKTTCACHQDQEDGGSRMNSIEEEESFLNAAADMMNKIHTRRHHRTTILAGKGKNPIVEDQDLDEDEESLEELEREEMELKTLKNKVTALLNQLAPPSLPLPLPLPPHSHPHHINNNNHYQCKDDIDLELHLYKN